MLRLTVSPLRESVLVIAQTRDRSGHAANPSDVTAAATYGVTPALGRAAHPVDSIGQYPYFDLDRDGTFDSVLVENNILGNPHYCAIVHQIRQRSPHGGLAWSR